MASRVSTSSHSSSVHLRSQPSVAGSEVSLPDTPEAQELERWNFELQRLASDSSTWQEWNVSDAYSARKDGEGEEAGAEEAVVRRRRELPATLEHLNKRLTQHEIQLADLEAQEDQLLRSVSAPVQLEDLTAQLQDLSDYLALDGKRMTRHQQAILGELENLTVETEALVLMDQAQVAASAAAEKKP